MPVSNLSCINSHNVLAYNKEGSMGMDINCWNEILYNPCFTHAYVSSLRIDAKNKTLGRARDPRANGAWLNKLTE